LSILSFPSGYRCHRGKRNNLHFWRDGKGNEIDLLVESGPDIMPVEIKSGATIRDDFFKGLRTFAKQLPQISISSLVYGGTEKQKRSDVLIWRASDIAEMMAKIN
jgi:predicted AAA+ superfamily ATPase